MIDSIANAESNGKDGATGIIQSADSFNNGKDAGGGVGQGPTNQMGGKSVKVDKTNNVDKLPGRGKNNPMLKRKKKKMRTKKGLAKENRGKPKKNQPPGKQQYFNGNLKENRGNKQGKKMTIGTNKVSSGKLKDKRKAGGSLGGFGIVGRNNRGIAKKRAKKGRGNNAALGKIGVVNMSKKAAKKANRAKKQPSLQKKEGKKARPKGSPSIPGRTESKAGLKMGNRAEVKSRMESEDDAADKTLDLINKNTKMIKPRKGKDNNPNLVWNNPKYKGKYPNDFSPVRVQGKAGGDNSDSKSEESNEKKKIALES